MKQKQVENFIYEGLGFPVVVHDVTLVEIDSEWHPQINVRKIADAAIERLAKHEYRLTGNQVKFIRNYFEMTLREFAALLDKSHMAVSKWENTTNKITKMDINTEKVLRLNILAKLSKTEKQQSKFYKNYQLLERKVHGKNVNQELDIPRSAVA